MPVLTLFALVGAGIGLWLPVFEVALFWPAAAVLVFPIAWWLCGPGLLVALAACMLSSLQCHWYLDALLPEPLVQNDIVVRGIIADFPRAEGDSLAFLFRLLPADSGGPFPENALLHIYAPELRPQAGEQWEFLVRLKRPVGTANYAGFDRDVWGLWNRIHANGYVRNSPLNRRMQERGSGTWLLRVRDTVRQRIDAALAGQPMAPLVQGITIAARQSIDAVTWQILRDSGTSHLMAISGLHIGLVAAFLWYPGRVAGWLLHCLGALADPLWFARVLAFSGAIAYGALAGYPTPTLRACLMIAAILLSGWRHRSSTSSLGVLCTAMLLVVLHDPLSILSAGFWLSFMAVALLYKCLSRSVDQSSGKKYLEAGRLENCRRFITAHLQAQFVLGVGLAVPSLVFFSQVSLVAFIANPIAIPAFTFFILPLSLLGAGLVTATINAGGWLLTVAAGGLDWLIATLRFLAAIPGATWRPVAIDGISLLLLLMASLASLIRRPLPGRLAGIALVCILLCRDSPALDGALRLQVLDVGQGLAVLVQTHSHSLLYDTGARWPGGDSGQTVVVPVLQANGIGPLDMLIVSHDDADHSGGVRSVMKAVGARRILAPAAGYLGIQHAVACRAGVTWEWDNVRFSVIHPTGNSGWSDNNSSCVLLIVAGNQQILLPGDIEAEAELHLVAEARLRDLSLVVAPHHGSRTSSSTNFVHAVSPRYVIFSAGYANRWGFPKADIVQRWVDSGACALTTAVSGALEFRVSSTGVLTLSDAARASWYWPWVLRDARAVKCGNTINGALAGV